MGHAERAVLGLDEEGLRVADGVAAGGRVAGVADDVVAGKFCQPFGGEDMADEPEILVGPGRLAVGHGHPGTLLTAVLQRMEAEEGDAGRLVGRRSGQDRSGEDAALVLRVVEPVERVRAHGRIPAARRFASMRGRIGSAPGSNVRPVSRS